MFGGDRNGPVTEGGHGKRSARWVEAQPVVGRDHLAVDVRLPLVEEGTDGLGTLGKRRHAATPGAAVHALDHPDARGAKRHTDRAAYKGGGRRRSPRDRRRVADVNGQGPNGYRD